MDVSSIRLHRAAGPEQRHRRDGCSWTVYMDADKNTIIIKALAIQSNSKGKRNIIRVELCCSGGELGWNTD